VTGRETVADGRIGSGGLLQLPVMKAKPSIQSGFLPLAGLALSDVEPPRCRPASDGGTEGRGRTVNAPPVGHTSSHAVGQWVDACLFAPQLGCSPSGGGRGQPREDATTAGHRHGAAGCTISPRDDVQSSDAERVFTGGSGAVEYIRTLRHRSARRRAPNEVWTRRMPRQWVALRP